MSRIGITYLEVAKLAQEIQIRGDHPTIEKIRVGLGGRGSNTTISKFLNEWRNQWNSALAKEITKQMPSLRLPESVNALMDNAWEQMDKEAQAEVEKIKQQTQKEIENIQLELIQVKDAQKKTLEHNTLLTHERRELLADKDKLTKENQELNQKIQNIEIEFSAIQKQLISERDIYLEQLDKIKILTDREVLYLKEEVKKYDKEQSDLRNYHEEYRQKNIVEIENLKAKCNQLEIRHVKLENSEKQAQEELKKILHETNIYKDIENKVDNFEKNYQKKEAAKEIILSSLKKDIEGKFDTICEKTINSVKNSLLDSIVNYQKPLNHIEQNQEKLHNQLQHIIDLLRKEDFNKEKKLNGT